MVSPGALISIVAVGEVGECGFKAEMWTLRAALLEGSRLFDH